MYRGYKDTEGHNDTEGYKDTGVKWGQRSSGLRSRIQRSSGCYGDEVTWSEVKDTEVT